MGINVKKLEWELFKSQFSTAHVANVIEFKFKYFISIDYSNGFYSAIPGIGKNYHKTIDDAKQFCQEHFQSSVNKMIL